MTGALSRQAGMDCLEALQPFLHCGRDQGGIADLRLEPSERNHTIDVVVVPYRPGDSEWVRLPSGVRAVLEEYGVTPAVSVERRDDRPVFLVASFPGRLDTAVGFNGQRDRSIMGP